MAEQKARGSIIYELLIVILGATLVASILYPKKITEQEQRNMEISRYRMEQIQKAALQYQKYNGTYSDTLEKVFEFIRTSPEYQHYVDSVIVGGLDSIITELEEFKTKQNEIAAAIPSATDSTMIDSLTELQTEIKLESRRLAGYVEYVHDRMKNLPNTPVDELRAVLVIIDSKKFTLDMDIVKNAIESGQQEVAQRGSGDVIETIESTIKQFERVKTLLPRYRGSSLDSIGLCPTTHKPFRLVHVDTSVIKFLNIYSPIDSADIAMVEHDFLKSKIGGMKLTNHGRIENGERSWAAQQ